MTSQPTRGPNGQRAPGGGVHEPPLGDRTTWASGSTKPQTRTSQAITVALMTPVWPNRRPTAMPG